MSAAALTLAVGRMFVTAIKETKKARGCTVIKEASRGLIGQGGAGINATDPDPQSFERLALGRTKAGATLIVAAEQLAGEETNEQCPNNRRRGRTSDGRRCDVPRIHWRGSSERVPSEGVQKKALLVATPDGLVAQTGEHGPGGSRAYSLRFLLQDRTSSCYHSCPVGQPVPPSVRPPLQRIATRQLGGTVKRSSEPMFCRPAGYPPVACMSSDLSCRRLAARSPGLVLASMESGQESAVVEESGAQVSPSEPK